VNTRRRLATWVVLDGQPYGPHSDLTPEQAARITNPLAWDDDPPPPDNTVSAAPTPPPGPDATGEPVAHPAVRTPPPRAGKGSGVEAWQAFAADHDVEIPAGVDRAAIIAACEHAGLLDPAAD
jgi:hypothetical protein